MCVCVCVCVCVCMCVCIWSFPIFKTRMAKSTRFEKKSAHLLLVFLNRVHFLFLVYANKYTFQMLVNWTEKKTFLIIYIESIAFRIKILMNVTSI